MVYIDPNQYLASCYCKSGMTKIIEIAVDHPCDVFRSHQNNPNIQDRLRNPEIFREQLCQNLSSNLLCKKGMCPITRTLFPSQKTTVPIEYVETNSRDSTLIE